MTTPWLRAVRASLGLPIVLAACIGDPSPPFDDAGAESSETEGGEQLELVVSVEDHSAYPAGRQYVLTLEDADLLPADFQSIEIEADCGGGWVPTGLTLTALHPIGTFHEPAAEPTPVVYDDSANVTLDGLLGAKDGVIAATVELLSPFYPETALEECMETPGCGDTLAELELQWEQLDADILDTLDVIEEVDESYGGFLPPELGGGCQFHGVAFAKRPGNGPGVVRVEEKTRTYDDWDKTVEIPGDPCEGKTPKQCYRDLIELYKKRACGLVDENGNPWPNPVPELLPEVCKRACKAIQNGWVDFPDIECKRLGVSGMTLRSKDGKKIAGLPGTRSRVLFDWEAFLRSGRSFLLFKHELDHVVHFAETEDLLARKKRLQKEANDLLDQALAKGREGKMDEAIAIAKQADAKRKQAEEACKNFLRDVLDDILERESRAFEGVIYAANEIIGGSPVSDGPNGDQLETQAVKGLVVGMLGELLWYLERDTYKDVKPSPTAAKTVCGRIKDVKTYVKGHFAEHDNKTIWDCLVELGKDLPEKDQLPKLFERVEKRLGC